jgi:hypothetical protein
MTYTLDWSETNLGGSAVVSYASGAILDFTDKPAGATAALSLTASRGNSINVTIAEFSIQTSGSSVMTFDYHTSSESGFDKLHIDVDGVSQAEFSGTTAWTSHAGINIASAGTHTIRFRYQKDSGGLAGEDRVWVALLNITSTVTTNDDTGSSDVYDMEGGGVPSVCTTSTWTNSTSEPIAGSRSLRSPATTAGSGSYDLDITKPATDTYRAVSFNWKVSSEAGWDKLYVFPDSTAANVPASGHPSSEGAPGWLNYSGTLSGRLAVIMPAAETTMRLRYAKDGSGDVGSDAAWIDTLHVGNDGAIDPDPGYGHLLLPNGVDKLLLPNGVDRLLLSTNEPPPAGDTIQAAVAFTSASTLSVSAPTLEKPAAVAMTAGSTLTVAAPAQTHAVAVSLTSTSTLTPAAFREHFVAVPLTSTSTLTPTAFRTQPVSVALTSNSTLTVAAPSASKPAEVTLAAASTLAVAAPLRQQFVAVALASTSTLAVAAPLRQQFVGTSLVATSTLGVGALVVHAVVAALTSTSTLTVAAFRALASAVALSGTSTLEVAVEGATSAATDLQAVSTLSIAAPLRTLLPTVVLTSTSTLSVSAPTIVKPTSVTLLSTSTLTVGVVVIRPAQVVLVSASTLTAAAQGAGEAGVALSNVSTLAVQALREATAAVALGGTSVLTTAAPDRIAVAAVLLTANNSLTIVAQRDTFAAVNNVATSTLTVTAVVVGPGDLSMSAFARMRPNFSYAKLRENESNAVIRPVWKVDA